MAFQIQQHPSQEWCIVCGVWVSSSEEQYHRLYSSDLLQSGVLEKLIEIVQDDLTSTNSDLVCNKCFKSIGTILKLEDEIRRLFTETKHNYNFNNYNCYNSNNKKDNANQKRIKLNGLSQDTEVEVNTNNILLTKGHESYDAGQIPFINNRLNVPSNMLSDGKTNKISVSHGIGFPSQSYDTLSKHTQLWNEKQSSDTLTTYSSEVDLQEPEDVQSGSCQISAFEQTKNVSERSGSTYSNDVSEIDTEISTIYIKEEPQDEMNLSQTQIDSATFPFEAGVEICPSSSQNGYKGHINGSAEKENGNVQELHRCKKCLTYFSSAKALDSHQELYHGFTLDHRDQNDDEVTQQTNFSQVGHTKTTNNDKNHLKITFGKRKIKQSRIDLPNSRKGKDQDKDDGIIDEGCNNIHSTIENNIDRNISTNTLRNVSDCEEILKPYIDSETQEDWQSNESNNLINTPVKKSKKHSRKEPHRIRKEMEYNQSCIINFNGRCGIITNKYKAMGVNEKLENGNESKNMAEQYNGKNYQQNESKSMSDHFNQHKNKRKENIKNILRKKLQKAAGQYESKDINGNCDGENHIETAVENDLQDIGDNSRNVNENVDPNDEGKNITYPHNEKKFQQNNAGDKMTGNNLSKVDQNKNRYQKDLACSTCGKLFKYQKELESHHKEVHNTDRPFVCDVCGKTWRHNHELIAHMRLHTGEGVHKCSYCSKIFNYPVQLKKHERIHTGIRPFVCETCGAAFTESGALKGHKRIHTGEKPYVCTVCGKGFALLCTMKKHKANHSENNTNTCDICEIRYKTQKALRFHVTMIHQTELECSICDKKFKSNSELCSHLSEITFSCDHCDKRFKRVKQLNQHKYKVHQKHKGCYICAHCGKEFARQCSLRRHEVLHTSEKKNTCEICGKQFFRLTDLVNHKKRHLGMKAYECDVCGMKFVQKFEVTKHYRSHTGERPHICKTCKQPFATARSLRAHEIRKGH